MMRRFTLGVAGVLAVSAQAAEHRGADMAGHAVVTAGPPRRIADLWFAHNGVMVMLGAADRIVATVDRRGDYPWMYRVAPVLGRAAWMAANTPDIEALVQARTDLVFIPQGEALRAECEQARLPVAAMTFSDVDGLRRSIALTAEILDDDGARAVARRYDAALTRTLADVARRVADVPEGKRPRVLHVESLSPLRVDGAGTIIDAWIRAAGGRNAASDITGNKRPVTLEQVIAWNPDVVVVSGVGSGLDAAGDRAAWDAVPAVKQGHVLRNPRGVFPWDRYGPEFLLQVRWAAKAFYPERFGDVDIVSDTREFYRDFYRYDLGVEEARAILAARPPAP